MRVSLVLRSTWFMLASVAATTVTLAGQPSASQQSTTSHFALQAPITFEANEGQVSDDTRYLARTAHYAALLKPNGMEMVLGAARPRRGMLQEGSQKLERPRVVEMKLLGADKRADIFGRQQEPGTSNYFIGDDATKWSTGVRHYAQVRVASAYPHVDLVYHMASNQVEYDFVVSPQGGVRSIRMHFGGQDHLSIDGSGNLVLRVGTKRLVMKRPIAYQIERDHRKLIPSTFVRTGPDEIGFTVATYDHTLPLTIDPTLEYSSYLGGSDDEGIFGIAFDFEGNIYVAGETSSLNFPTSRAPQRKLGGDYDAFVSKFDRTGTKLIYSTYLGGSMYDHAVGLALDPGGDVVVAGITTSPDFPVVHPIQRTLNGSSDAFVAKLDRSGSKLLFSTYLGGSAYDQANGIALNASGDVFVAGSTTSFDYPTTPGSAQVTCDLGAHQGFCNGDGFVTKLNAAGSQVLYSTFFGGSSYDQINAVKVDREGSAYVVGQTGSIDFPTRNAFQPALAGYDNAFLAKVSPDGSAIEDSSYLGGSNFDAAMDVSLDDKQNAYVTGFTGSTDFPTLRPIQGSLAGQLDAFVVKVNREDFRLQYATYLGGIQDDTPFRIVVDALGSASIAGFTFSPDFPVKGAIQPKYQGGADVFVSRLDPTGSALSYSSYFGELGDEFGYALQTDLTGALWVGGSTSSSDLPLHHPFQARYGGGPYDAFLTKTALQPNRSLEVLEAAIEHLESTGTLSRRVARCLVEALGESRAALGRDQGAVAIEALYLYEGKLLIEASNGSLTYKEAVELGLAGYEIVQTIE